MSSCLRGGGRAYGFDLEIVKSPSTSSRISHSPSPSLTLSESGNYPIAISTRKPRTPRKRPNQTYNEAAALLSTACPNVFSSKHLTKVSKSTKQHSYFFDEPPQLLLPFGVIENLGFLLHQPILEKPNFHIEPRVLNSCEKQCQSPGAIDFHGNYNSNSIENSMEMELGNGYQDDFDTELMLDEEIEEGIDSIMGNLSVENDSNRCGKSNTSSFYNAQINTCYGYPMGLELGFNPSFDFNFNFGIRSGVVRVFRNVEEGNWWSFPTVEVADVKPKVKKVSVEKKKKKVEKPSAELKNSDSEQGNLNSTGAFEENSNSETGSRLLLELNYDGILNAWSDRGSPLPKEISGSESPGNDIHAKLAQMDLFSENGGVREASVMRCKEKRRTRLFSKKIRYQVRKVNADRRPRMKGRFVRRPNSAMTDDR